MIIANPKPGEAEGDDDIDTSQLGGVGIVISLIRFLSRMRESVQEKLNRFALFWAKKTPEKARKPLLNAFLAVEILFFLGAAAYNHSLVDTFNNALNATTIGGLYSALIGLMDASEQEIISSVSSMTWDTFFVWSCSGITYLALTSFNEVTSYVKYGRPMQIIHNVLFSLTLGVVGAP